MSDIVVRPYEPRDQEQTWHVRAMTYNNGRPIPVEEQVYKTSTPFVAEVDGRILGTYVVMDMVTARGGQAEWKTAGIAGVAVLPEARQSGTGSAMMRWALKDLRARGYILASLYGYRESYYRKFGYESCGLRLKLTIPMDRLPRRKPELPVRRAEVSDIASCYEAFAKARSGMNLREDMHWGRILNEHRAIYSAGDPAEAYAIIDHDVYFWREQPIAEFGWTTARGYDSMLAFFAGLGINKTSLSWHEPSDGQMLARHLDQGMQFEMEKPIMYRLLNPRAALTSLAATGEGEFTMAMRDPAIPDNEGAFRVSFGGGSTKVESCSSAELEMDPHTAVQAFLGQPSLDDLVRNRVVADVQAARTLLPALPVYCTDFF